ncbi:MAG: SpoIIIAH-like family protein, partial [Oscillospiraceae bacterium]|nr:SpoIIIAH-like family protein [Oscillospiraceae bacterium]
LLDGATPTPGVTPDAGADGNEAEPQAPQSKTTTGYFASARLNRQQARDSALAILRETMASENAEEAAKLEAGAAIEALASSTVSEAQIENLVIAKGYTDCIAFISEGGVSVVVSATEGGLRDSDVAKIAEIVTGETGVAMSQVSIIEANG